MSAKTAIRIQEIGLVILDKNPKKMATIIKPIMAAYNKDLLRLVIINTHKNNVVDNVVNVGTLL